jgi:uncharacterized repeat protein (TIGR01451 family)
MKWPLRRQALFSLREKGELTAGIVRLGDARLGLLVALLFSSFAVIAVPSAGATIGPGSCQGANACLSGVTGSVGTNSCDGQAACQGVVAGSVGNSSCKVDYACEGGVTGAGSVGNNSCNGPDHACSGGVSANVGNSSCRGQSSCAGGVSANVGDHSCSGSFACTSGVSASVGDNSCSGGAACYYGVSASVGDNSCSGNSACYYGVRATVGKNSCNGPHACPDPGGIVSSVGDCQRNVPGHIPPVCQGPDLIIEKIVSQSQWVVGQTYTFTTKVTNQGYVSVPAGVVIFARENPLPAGLTLVSTSEPGCPANPTNVTGVITCLHTGPALGPGQSWSMTWTVQVTSMPPGTPPPASFHNCVLTGGFLIGGPLPEADLTNNDDCVDIPAVNPTLDHFKCYVAHNPGGTPILPQFGGSVSLKDEFDGTSYASVGVGALVHFCNPVQKTYLSTVTPVANPALHLAIYTITTTTVGTHSIVISNQFGSSQSMQVGPPSWLAVPTTMNSNSPPNPAALGHFKCYPVNNISVDLFDPSFNHAEPGVVIAGAPFMFCNAAEKIHVFGGTSTTYPAVNPSQHLLCYTFAFSPFTTSVKIRNQFNNTGLTVTGADLLCLPTTLISATVP